MSLEKAIAEEKQRIKTAIDDLTKQKKAIDKQIDDLHREMGAVLAYEDAKKGKPVRRTRGTSVKAQILALVKANPMTRGQLIEELDVKGQTVSNSLSALKKDGKVAKKGNAWVASV